MHLKQPANRQLFQAVKSAINLDIILEVDERKGENYFRWVVRRGLFQDVTSVLTFDMVSQSCKAEDAFRVSEQVKCCQKKKATPMRVEQRPVC